jgi:hypothetical protein
MTIMDSPACPKCGGLDARVNGGFWVFWWVKCLNCGDEVIAGSKEQAEALVRARANWRDLPRRLA